MDIGESAHAAGSVLPEHAHDQWRLVVVLEGAFEERATHGTRRCAAATVILRAAGEEHGDVFRAPTRYASIALGDLPTGATTFAATPLAPRLARALMHGDRPNATVLMSRILRQLIAPEPVDARVRVARETIERCFASRLRVSDLARESGLHPATLARAFRAAYGCNPVEFLVHTRIRAAMDAIATRGETPAAVALRCGFYDQSHFANAFRRLTGMTPRAFAQASVLSKTRAPFVA